MDGLSMCRICLVQNIRRYAVADRHLLDFYEKLTDFPFETDDNRPLLVCAFCYNKLKKCCQLLQMCLIAEELFNQMASNGYEPNTPLIYPGKFEYFGGLTTTPIEHVSILDRWEEQGFADEDEAASEDVDSSREDCAPPETVDVKEERLHYKEQKIEVELLNVGKQDHIEQEEHCLGSTDAKIPTLGERSATTEDTDSGQRKMLNSKVIPTNRTRTSRPTVKNKENSKKAAVKKHLDKKPYTCDVCQRTFKIKYLLDSHILIHTGEKPYTCDICQNSFRLKRSLYSHIRVHTGEKPYKCKQCPKSFRQITHLKHHVLTHTSEKPYPCDVCQHRFTTKSNLQTHYRVHTNEKPHKCHICQRSFKTRWILKHHILTHTGEKPHKCQICQRSFSRKANLENHILIHNDKKQYQCEICAKFFSQASSLNGHLRVHIKLGKKLEETSLMK